MVKQVDRGQVGRYYERQIVQNHLLLKDALT